MVEHKDKEELRTKIKEYPNDPMNYYYLGKELLKEPLKDIFSIKEIEKLFEKAIELGPTLWAPRIFLGELLYKLGKFEDAELYFREVLDMVPESVSVKEYLAKCIAINSESKGEIKKTSQKDSLYLFENDIREFIKIILKNNYGNKWWRTGVPQKVRAKCAGRREEGLEEEKDADLLLFADFYSYKEIIEHNKKIFVSYINTKEWCNRLGSMEPIRNALSHNRPSSATSKIKDCCFEFREILAKTKINIENM